MNSEQLQDFLTDVGSIVSKGDKTFQRGEEAESVRKFLAKTSQNTLLCIAYLHNNYTDIDLIQPIVAQILALYYRGGILRQYALQYVPPLIGTYLFSLSKRQHKSGSVFETFFLAIYNEEILAGGPGSDNVTKRVEEVRVPSIRYPSIYHDPSKINTLPEITTIRPGGSPIVQTTVRIGPFPSIERFISETKFFVLTRIMKSVNSGLCYLSSDAVSRHVCLSTISICQSGFSFPESNLRARVLDTEMSNEVLDEYSKKPRQHVSSALLLELLTGCYLALFNGAPDLALRAIDAVHHRAQYEMFPQVLLVTNSIRNSLLENPLSKEKRDELMWSRDKLKDKYCRKDCVTNASLRIRKMPEDIPILPDPKEKEHSKVEDIIDDIQGGVDHIKKKMSQLSHHHKKKHFHSNGHHNARKEGIEVEELELSTINEDGQGEVIGMMSNVDRPSEIEGRELTPERQSDSGRVESDSGSEGDKHKIEKHSRKVSERGAYSVNGFRHMDSGSGTERSDY